MIVLIILIVLVVVFGVFLRVDGFVKYLYVGYIVMVLVNGFIEV